MILPFTLREYIPFLCDIVAHTHTHTYIYISKPTIVEGDPEAPFSIATKPRCPFKCCARPLSEKLQLSVTSSCKWNIKNDI